jgi:hypothetical protein
MLHGWWCIGRFSALDQALQSATHALSSSRVVGGVLCRTMSYSSCGGSTQVRVCNACNSPNAAFHLQLHSICHYHKCCARCIHLQCIQAVHSQHMLRTLLSHMLYRTPPSHSHRGLQNHSCCSSRSQPQHSQPLTASSGWAKKPTSVRLCKPLHRRKLRSTA